MSRLRRPRLPKQLAVVEPYVPETKEQLFAKAMGIEEDEPDDRWRPVKKTKPMNDQKDHMPKTGVPAEITKLLTGVAASTALDAIMGAAKPTEVNKNGADTKFSGFKPLQHIHELEKIRQEESHLAGNKASNKNFVDEDEDEDENFNRPDPEPGDDDFENQPPELEELEDDIEEPEDEIEDEPEEDPAEKPAEETEEPEDEIEDEPAPPRKPKTIVHPVVPLTSPPAFPSPVRQATKVQVKPAAPKTPKPKPQNTGRGLGRIAAEKTQIPPRRNLVAEAAAAADEEEQAVVAEPSRPARNTAPVVQLAAEPTRSTPLLPEDLTAIVENIPNTLRWCRNKAMLLLGFSAALRRSELVLVRVEGLRFTDEGLAVAIPSNHEGKADMVFVPNVESKLCAVEAVARWISDSGVRSGYLFRRTMDGKFIDRDQENHLPPSLVDTIVKRAVRHAGLDANSYSGRSLRTGYAEAVERQRSVRDIDTLRRFFRP